MHLCILQVCLQESLQKHPLTFFVLDVDLLLLRSSPAGQLGGGDEEGQQSGEEAVVCHRQHKAHQES